MILSKEVLTVIKKRFASYATFNYKSDNKHLLSEYTKVGFTLISRVFIENLYFSH